MRTLLTKSVFLLIPACLLCPAIAAPYPTLLKDINAIPAAVSSNPQNITAVGSMVFFTATDDNGSELWKSDGTSAGTVMVKDILSGSGNSNPNSLTNVNGTLFFTASDGVNGRELWKSDGTSAGTVMVKDIASGSGSSSPNSLTNVNGTLFFSAFDGGSTLLFRSDGSLAGTVPVTTPNVPFIPQGMVTTTGNTVFFAGSLSSTGTELFSFNSVVSASDPTNLSFTSVTLNGSVNPGGLPTTGVLEYGTTTSYGNSVPLSLSPDDGNDWQDVSVPLSELTPGTTYHYRFSVTNSSGTFTTQNATFTITTAQDVYNLAVQAAGLTGDDAASDAVPFNDGVKNLLKYAFNMNLAGQDISRMSDGGTSGLPFGRRIEIEEAHYFQVQYVVRKNSGLIYAPQKSNTLMEDSFSQLTGTVTEVDIDETWKRITINEPYDPTNIPKCFFRVGVNLP